METTIRLTPSQDSTASSQPPSPTRSLFRASASVDELTATLTSLRARAPTPEPPPTELTYCCAGHAADQCPTLCAWHDLKAKLDGRLVLSAQVGQALLQKYEAYVRRHEKTCQVGPDDQSTEDEDITLSVSQLSPEQLTPGQMSTDSLTHEEMLQHKIASLEKRLAEALLNAEVSDTSHSTLLTELNDTRATVARLSTQHARALGWESRLKTALHERDDAQQERDALVSQARVSDSRMGVLKDKCTKLQDEVRRLQKELQNQHRHRLELSEEILQEARTRIQNMHVSHASEPPEGDEMAKVLETLVADNEDLQRSNREFQSLLQDSRDDVRALQSELDELRAVPAANPDRPYMRHRYTGSAHSSILSDVSGLHFNPPFTSPAAGRFNDIQNGGNGAGSSKKRPISMNFQRSVQDNQGLTTPETSTRPLSPLSSDFSPTDSGTRYTSFAVAQTDDSDFNTTDTPVRPKPKKSLLLLNRNVGVQTDSGAPPSPSPGRLSPGGWLAHAALSPPAYSDGPSARSESSSLTDASQMQALAGLIERSQNLLTRLAQADALTLTTRLKRQHLGGADSAIALHLSKTTVESIVSESQTLRNTPGIRPVLEDEKAVLGAGRREIRMLLKLVKDAIAEMGAMRVALNCVVLDPASVGRIREEAMNPALASAAAGPGGARSAAATPGAGAGSAAQGPGAAGWMAPLSKLFGAQATPTRPDTLDTRKSTGSLGPLPRIAPKQRAALAASTTTVNVEFSGTGVGRAVTNTWKEDAARRPVGELPREDGAPVHLHAGGQMLRSSSNASRNSGNSGVMGIFAGAPQREVDPWVVIPSGPPSAVAQNSPVGRRMGGPPNSREASTLGRSATLRSQHARVPFSRNIDGLIDTPAAPVDAEGVEAPPLLQRTLRRRGLSDSSMHSTFSSHADPAHPGSPPRSPPRGGPGPAGRMVPGPAGRQRAADAVSAGLLGQLGKRVASFRFGTPALGGGGMDVAAERRGEGERAVSPVQGFTAYLPGLSGLSEWASAAGASGMDEDGRRVGTGRSTRRGMPEDLQRTRGWMGDDVREM